MVDLNLLLQKVTGDELSAEEFVSLVQAVKDNQDILANPKVGWVLKRKEGSATLLYFFESQADADAYDNGTSTKYITSIALPDSGSGTASYVVRLRTLSDSTIETSTRNVSIKLLATSLLYNPVTAEAEDTGEDVSLTIQRRIGTDGEWANVGKIAHFNTVMNKDEFTEADYTSVNLSEYLVNGEQSLRIVARGNTSDVASTYALFTVVVAEMGIEFATDWQNAFVYDSLVASSAKMSVGFRIKGSVNKELNWELYDPYGTMVNYGKQEVGTSEYSESKYYMTIDHPQGVGIYIIKAWLNYANTSIVTETISQNIMVTKVGDETTLVCVNNVANPIINWSSQHMFDYAVYNPTALNGLSDVKMELTSSDNSIIWVTSNIADVANGTMYDYTQYLSIENYTEDGNRVQLFSSRLSIYVEDVLAKSLTFSVDNTNDFAPTAGADFVMLPSMRSNNDTDREYIRNESSLTTVEKSYLATWNNVLFEQDGWIIEDNVRRLRLFSGSSVTIPYEPYSNYTQSAGLTVELDFAVMNVNDESESVLTIGKENVNGKFVGIKIFPKRGYVFSNEQNSEYFQDFEWQEDQRTHIAVNIMPALEITNVGRLNAVRIFINGTIDREFKFLSTDSFWNGNSCGGIVIGSQTADVDVFGIRIFKDKQLSHSQIFNDYVASVSDVETKMTLIEANNIMEGGVISYERTKDKYNTLVWTGSYPSYANQATTSGSLEINKVGDLKHSGTINNMSCKGQGTSAKKYWYWNGSFSFNDESVWVNGNGEEVGAYYNLDDKCPNATKLVGKINWASSMQTHKRGMVSAFQELYDEIFDGSVGYEPNGITTLSGYENTRIAVKQEPFLFFIKESEESTPKFFGLMTFGPGKGDKLTFGYDKKNDVLKDYLMIEGSDQTPKLTLCQVPWFEDEVIYDEKEEYYTYNGVGSFDVPLGNLDSITHLIKAHNLCFEYSTRIMYYNGNLTSLQKDENADKSFQYFLVGQSYGNFNLYRYDWITSKWVNAGILKDSSTDDGYALVNLNTQLGLSVSSTEADFDLVLNTFKDARISAFRSKASQYFHINDMLYCMSFLKFIAGSDNRAKNTYLYYDPVSKLIRNAQDDLDTVLKTNNQGQKQKPYWVEEHDFDSRPSFNSYFWAAQGNAMYNLFEDAYPTEMRNMMYKIMDAMATLGGSLMGFWDKYFFDALKMIPAVAYNETAKLWYETARIKMDNGEYSNDTDPLSQSLGNQEQCEREWLKQRIIYMGSYCMYGYALGSDIEFRQLNSSIYKQIPYLKMYLYREFGTTKVYPIDTATGLTAKMPLRFNAGEIATFNVIGGDSQQCTTKAAEHLTSIGDLSTASVVGSVGFAAGKRLTSLKLGDENGSLFNVSVISSFPKNVSEIILTNCGEQLTSIADMTKLSKLKTFKALGTGITSAYFPQTNNLETIWLPSSVNTLVLKNQTNINDFIFDKSSLLNLTMGNVNIDDQTFVTEWLSGIEDDATILSSYKITLDKIDWSNVSGDLLSKLAHFGYKNLKGTIRIDDYSLTPEQKQAAIDAFGDIDSETNDLHVIYANKLTAEVTPPYIIGGKEESELVITSLNTDVTLTITSSSNLVSVTKVSQSIENNSLYAKYKVSAVAVEVNTTVTFTITDGAITLKRDVVIRRQSHITGVNMSKNQYKIDNETLFVASTEAVPVYATVAPQDMTDSYILRWGLKPKNSSYIANTTVLSGIEYVQLIHVDTNEIYAVIPTQGQTLSTLQGKNEVTVMIIDTSAKKNDILFEVTCTAVVDGVDMAEGGLSVVNHAYYKEYAIQSFDTEAANYNPFVAIKMYEAGIGGTWEVIENIDGSKGVALSYEEAAKQLSLSCPDYFSSATLVDSNGNCVESYSDGVLDSTKTYTINSFNELRFFTSLITFNADHTGSNRTGIKFKEIHIPSTATIDIYLDEYVETKLVFESIDFLEKHKIYLTYYSNNCPTNNYSVYLPNIVNVDLTTNSGRNYRYSWGRFNRQFAIKIYNSSIDNIVTELNVNEDSVSGNIWNFNLPDITTINVSKNLQSSRKINVNAKVYYEGTLAEWSQIKFNGGGSSPASNSGYLYVDNGITRVNGAITTTPNEDGEQYAAFEGLPITEVTIGAGTTALKPYCFNNCTKLTKVNLIEGITELSNNCFYNCTSLSDIELKEGIAKIGSSCFYNCSSLTSLTTPSTTRNIGDTFITGSKIVKLTLNEGLLTIGSRWGGPIAPSYMNCLPDTITSYGLVRSVEDGKFYAGINFKIPRDVLYLKGIPNPVGAAPDTTFYNIWYNALEVVNDSTNIFIAYPGRTATITNFYIAENVTYLHSYLFNHPNTNSTHYIQNLYSYPKTAPTITPALLQPYSAGGTIYVPTDATGYEEGGWATLIERGFVLSKTL